MDNPTVGKIIANLILNDLKGLLKQHKLKIEDCPVDAEVIGFLGRMAHQGILDKKQVKKHLTNIFNANFAEKSATEISST